MVEILDHADGCRVEIILEITFNLIERFYSDFKSIEVLLKSLSKSAVFFVDVSL